MGVKGLRSQIEDIFKDKCLKKQVDFQVDHLFYDLNSNLHKSGKKVPTASMLNYLLGEVLRKEIQLFKPTSTLFLSLDGPSPISKIPNQRLNREKKNSVAIERIKYESEIKRKLSTNIDQPLLEFVDEDLIRDNIPKSVISPGTEFMGYAKSYLYHFVLRKSNIKLPKRVFISGADRAGEGEWKIFQHINNSNYSKDDNILISSKDSDIIVSSLLSKVKNIYIYDGSVVIDIQAIRESIFSRVNAITDQQKRDSLVGFSILCLFKGGDHFPSLQYYNLASSIENYLNSGKIKLYDEKEGKLDIQLFNSIAEYNKANREANGNKDTDSKELKKLWERVVQIYSAHSDTLLHSKHASIYHGDQLIESDISRHQALSKFLKIDHPFWKKHQELLNNQDSKNSKHLYKIFNLFSREGTLNSNEKESGLTLNEQSKLPLVELAIGWNLKYFNGQCDNFSFCLPFNRINSNAFVRLPDNQNDTNLSLIYPNDDDSAPLSPLLYGFLIMDYTNKSLFPPEFHQIYKLFPEYYGLDIEEANKEFYKSSSISNIKKEFNRIASQSSLSKFQSSQLKLQPTIQFEIDYDKNSVTLYQEIHQSNRYMKIKTFSLSTNGLNKFAFDMKFVLNNLNHYSNPYINQSFKNKNQNNNNNNNNNNSNNNQNDIKFNIKSIPQKVKHNINIINQVSNHQSQQQQQQQQQASQNRFFSTKSSLLSSSFNYNGLNNRSILSNIFRLLKK